MLMLSFFALKSWVRAGLLFAALVLLTTLSTSLRADIYCESPAAVGNLVQNCGFELVDVNGTTVSNWTASIGSTIARVTGGPPTLDGSTFKGRYSDTASTAATTLTQGQISLLAGVTYDVSFDYYISNSTFKFQIGNALSPLFDTGNLNNPLNNTMVRYTNSFTSLVDQTVSIQFATILADKSTLYLDNVIIRPQLAVPEPTTMILMGSLCSAVAGYTYKRKRSVES